MSDAASKAAVKVQRLERGRQARSLKRLAAPYTPQQQRALEDALSQAVDAAMGVPAAEGRLGFIARYIVAIDDGKPPPEAPKKRAGKLSEEQVDEVKVIMAAVHRAVNLSNCKVGSPLRNVAEHLFSQHRSAMAPKPPPMSAEERERAARALAMKSSAPMAGTQGAPAPMSAEELAAHEAAVAEEEENDPLVIEAKEAARQTFATVDKKKTGEIGKEHLFAVIRALGHVPGFTKEEQDKYLLKEFVKADKDGSGTVDFGEFVSFYVDLVCQTEAEEKARDAFGRFDVDGGGELEKHELFQVGTQSHGLLSPSPLLSHPRILTSSPPRLPQLLSPHRHIATSPPPHPAHLLSSQPLLSLPTLALSPNPCSLSQPLLSLPTPALSGALGARRGGWRHQG